jgi:hypothetical protein
MNIANHHDHKWFLSTTFILASIAWLFYLFLQTGCKCDEAEHAHAAWLISSGKEPIVDFFQHHQPFLWSLLTPYFYLGYEGPSVLIWGRTLVVICGFGAIMALLRLARLNIYKDSMGASILKWLGVLYLISFTILMPQLFVIRPETISTTAILISLVLWHDAKSNALMLLIAGILAGVALYSSPRFFSLGGLFLILGRHLPIRWVLVVSGGMIFLIIYTLASGFHLDRVLFNIQFSSHLLSMGTSTYGIRHHKSLLLMIIILLPLSSLLMLVPKNERIISFLLIMYSIVTYLAGLYFAGNYNYPQAYAPFMTVSALTISYMAAHAKISRPYFRMRTGIIALAFLPYAVTLVIYSQPKFDFLKTLQAREILASTIPPSEKILLFYTSHPITVQDISYYSSPLSEYRDRICSAVETFGSSMPLPKCDLAHLFDERGPYVTDAKMEYIVPLKDKKYIKETLTQRYRPLEELPIVQEFLGKHKLPRIPITPWPDGSLLIRTE